MMELPIFPLHAVLVPGAELPLKVFEVRYVDMVSACLKRGEPFGICLIQSGREVGAAAVPQAVGTLAHIIECDMPEPGILMLRVRGGERFRIRSRSTRGELVMAEVEVWPPEPELEVPERYAPLVEFLQQLEESRETGEAPNYHDASWVSWRLAELLPVIHDIRQRWLEMRDPVMRLADIQRSLSDLLEGLAEDENEE